MARSSRSSSCPPSGLRGCDRRCRVATVNGADPLHPPHRLQHLGQVGKVVHFDVDVAKDVTVLGLQVSAANVRTADADGLHDIRISYTHLTLPTSDLV